jgi:4-amino-4-deoxy-L-arabinose transferase-like glycosyltransferase
MSDAPRPLHRWLPLLVFVAALAPRLLLALTQAVEPVWDGHYYHFGARRIAEGHGYSDDAVIGGVLRWHPWCHYPVGYSGLLAIPYRLFGAGPQVGPVLNALLGALAAALVFLLVRRIAGRSRGLLAATLVACSPELLLFTLLLMTEPSASLAPLLAALAAGAGLRRGRPGLGAAAAGLALGLGTLVRPQTLLGAPGLLLLALDPWALRSSAAGALRVAALATVTALAVVAPWTLRNCRVMDGCALVSTNAGWNLAIGAFPRATGRFETLRAADGCPVVTGQVQQDRCWARVGMFHIKEAPARWLGLIPAKLSNTYDHSSFAAGYLAEAHPRRFGGERREVLRKVMSVAHGLLLFGATLSVVGAPWRLQGRARWVQGSLLGGLGLLGLYLATRAATPLWWLAVLTPALAALPLPGRPALGGEARYLLFTYGALSVTHAIFFGEDRYHVFLTPTLAVLCGLALWGPEPGGSRGGAVEGG